MGILEICSNASYWRGLDYFKSGKVKQIQWINRNECEAIVSGTEDYLVHLDIDHPRRSTCTCPHAKGNSKICKHKTAVYFALFPEAVEEAKRIQEDYQREEEEKQERLEIAMAKQEKSIRKYVKTLSEKEVRERLVIMMLSSVYEEYVNGYDRYGDFDEGW